MKQQIRQDIRKVVSKFVKEEKIEILHISTPQGSGKTVTTLLTLNDMGKHYIYLTKEHNLIENKSEDKALDGIELIHIKGMKQHCVKLDEYKQAIKWNINPKEFLCPECKYKDGCPYFAQFDDISTKSWAGSHYHLPMVEKMVRTDSTTKYDALVIDEDFVGAITTETRFNRKHLNRLGKLLDETMGDISIINKNGSVKASYKPVSDAHLVLKDTIAGLSLILDAVDTHKDKRISSMDVIKALRDHSTTDALLVGQEYGFLELRERYLSILYQKLYSNEEGYQKFKNIFDPVVDIVKLYKKYRFNDDDNIVPIKAYQKKDNNEIWLGIVNKELPDLPIIMLDATGSIEFVKKMFNRPVNSFDSSIDIERNIIQPTDGKYTLRSMGDIGTRNRVYHFAMLWLEDWLKKGVQKVYVVIHKRYSTEKNELYKPERKPPVDTRGKSIEHYLKEHNVDMSKVVVTWYEDMIGKDITDLKENGKLIVIGCPEPSFKIYPDQVSIFFEGEPPLSAERIKELEGSEFFRKDYRYKDERYFAMIKRVREHVLEHVIERLRFIEKGWYKECLLICSLPIKFDTQRMSMKEALKMKGLEKDPVSANLKVLKLVADKGMMGRKELVKKIREWKVVEDLTTDEEHGYQIVIDRLVRNGMINSSTVKQKYNIKEYYQATEKGRKYIADL